MYLVIVGKLPDVDVNSANTDVWRATNEYKIVIVSTHRLSMKYTIFCVAFASYKFQSVSIADCYKVITTSSTNSEKTVCVIHCVYSPLVPIL